jgi:hypothetical protein
VLTRGQGRHHHREGRRHRDRKDSVTEAPADGAAAKPTAAAPRDDGGLFGADPDEEGVFGAARDSRYAVREQLPLYLARADPCVRQAKPVSADLAAIERSLRPEPGAPPRTLGPCVLSDSGTVAAAPPAAAPAPPPAAAARTAAAYGSLFDGGDMFADIKRTFV